MLDLNDKVILVTGASSGIGAAAAIDFARCGCRVGVHYNSHPEDAEKVLAQIKEEGGDGRLFRADVTKPSQLSELAVEVEKAFGRVDVLVNNAGGFIERRPLMDADDDLIDRVFALNARSMLILSRQLVPLMRRGGGGSIVNVTSQAARTGGSLGAGLYSSCKGYVSTLTKALAKELVVDKIRVNAVAPGVIATPIHDGHTTPALLEKLREGIPMGRLGRADECSGAILFLSSERLASYITGQVIEVNGGSVMP